MEPSRDTRRRLRSRSRSPVRGERREERSERGGGDSRRDERDSKGKGREREERRPSGRDGRDDRNDTRRRSRSRSPARRSLEINHNNSRRQRSRSRSPARRRSRSRSASDSGSDSETSRERRHRKKKHSEKKRERSGDREEERDYKGRTKSERRALREERKEKKERKLRKKKGLPKVIEWGKHGILTEADIYTKDQEFRAWLIEERMINPETIAKAKLKEEFKTFMEEFNTATFNSDKYYDLTKYEARMNSLRMGETISTSEIYDARADELAIKRSHTRAVVETETFLDRSKLEALRQIQTDRVVMERMLRLGMTPKDSMGVRTEEKDEAGMRQFN